MKKIVYLLIVSFVLFLGTKTASADHSIEGKYFEVPMRELIELGIMDGTGDPDHRDYQHDRIITRVEFAALMVRALGKEEMIVTNPTPFSDVKSGDWYYNVVQQSAQLGIINGKSDGTFAPKEKVTREQIASIMNNALEKQGIILPDGDFSTYKDAKKVSRFAERSMKRIVGAGILKGSNNELNPQGESSRGMTSAFLVRMLDIMKNPPQPKYYVATATSDQIIKGKEFDNFADAKTAATDKNAVVVKNNKVIYMKSGIVTNIPSLSTLKMYNNSSFSYIVIGVDSGTPVEFVNSDEKSVSVRFGKKKGIVKMEEAVLIPDIQVKGRSYYRVSNGLLTHYPYNVYADKQESYLYGRSDVSMPDGDYLSDNGSTYTNKISGKTYEAYQYFNMLPLYTKTSYTAEQLNQYVKEHKPDSVGTTVLETMGGRFKQVESEHNINALYMLAHAIQESHWGTYDVETKNLFGLGAVDGSGEIFTFNSYDECFDALVYNLTNSTDSFFVRSPYRYHGAFLGNKDLGMNVFYSTDPYWGQKIAGLMHRIDIALQGKERNKYDIAVTVIENYDTNVRSIPSVNNNQPIYKLTETGTPVLVLDTVKTESEGTWYAIAPKHLDGVTSEKAFVYSHGAAHGTNMRLLKLAKE